MDKGILKIKVSKNFTQLEKKLIKNIIDSVKLSEFNSKIIIYKIDIKNLMEIFKVQDINGLIKALEYFQSKSFSIFTKDRELQTCFISCIEYDFEDYTVEFSISQKLSEIIISYISSSNDDLNLRQLLE